MIAINQNAGIEAALISAAKNAVRNIPANSVIAIVYISAEDQTTANYIADELEYIWVNESSLVTADHHEIEPIEMAEN